MAQDPKALPHSTRRENLPANPAPEVKYYEHPALGHDKSHDQKHLSGPPHAHAHQQPGYTDANFRNKAEAQPADSADTSKTASTPKQPPNYGVRKWIARGALYLGLAATGYLTTSAPGRVQTNDGGDPTTGMSDSFKAQMEASYGKRSKAEMKAELDAAVAAAEARKKAGSGGAKVEVISPEQAAQRQLNQGFAEANAPTGRPDVSPSAQRAGQLAGAALLISLFMRRMSGGSMSGLFGKNASGLTNQLYGHDHFEKTYNLQIKAQHGAGPGGIDQLVRKKGSVTENWNNGAQIAEGQSLPPRLLPGLNSMRNGSRVELNPTDNSLAAKQGETLSEKYPGVFPAPSTKKAKPTGGPT